MRITSTITLIVIFLINITGSIFIVNNYRVEEQLYFETVRKGYFCNHINKADYIINTYQEWETLWNLMFSDVSSIPTIPNINFLENTVIASYMGEKSTSGYEIEIIRIVDTGALIIVRLVEKSPNEGDGVFPAFTQPYHIVKTEKITKAIIINQSISYNISSFNINLVFIFLICVICGLIFYIRLRKIKLG
ncbi:MAG: protease complex subunit PrcB family protein [Promethearchaeota archaeon]